MNNKQRATLYHEFAKLLAAGLHIDRSIELLLDQRPAAPVRNYLKGIERGLSERLGFAESISRYSGAGVTHLEKSLLAAGERGGQLEQACEHLAHYFELRQKSVDKAVGALVYPLIILHMGLLLPDLISTFSGKGLDEILPALILKLVVVWGLLIGGFLLWQNLAKSAASSTTADSFIRTLPLIGSISKHWALARFSQVFQTGLLAALNIVETLKLAGEASQSALISTGADQAAQSVKDGKTLTESLRKTGAFPRSFVNSVDTAENTGALDQEMGRWAEIEGGLAARAQDRAAEWLPRIFYFIVVLYIAWRIISMFMGIYGQNGLYDSLLNGG